VVPSIGSHPPGSCPSRSLREHYLHFSGKKLARRTHRPPRSSSCFPALCFPLFALFIPDPCSVDEWALGFRFPILRIIYLNYWTHESYRPLTHLVIIACQFAAHGCPLPSLCHKLVEEAFDNFFNGRPVPLFQIF
jgi:hypothetical protein